MTKTQLVCRYVRECITDVAWWSSARRGGSARRTVPRDCPGLWRLMVFLFLFLVFFWAVRVCLGFM
ncbi:hypothetical protein ES332_A07G035200v1 [Gossypium tomentosum]|uniref:Uncharacterized protein n=1 Tax=Gossypium tomentosum TaxID=34277 RepID=A0A5D2PQZ7_GOSTO|nr:hypothetical protein ES332_A07G035200v1 [Gossypium tomentosum]